MIKYPEEFKNKAMELYPDDVFLHTLLKNDSPKVGNFFIKAERIEIIRAILRCKTIEEAHAIAAREIERDELREMWIKVMGM